MQEKKAALPSKIPKVSLLKHSLPQDEEREGERKKTEGRKRERKTQKGGDERKRDGQRGGLKRVEHKREKEKKEGAGIPHWTE